MQVKPSKKDACQSDGEDYLRRLESANRPEVAGPSADVVADGGVQIYDARTQQAAKPGGPPRAKHHEATHREAAIDELSAEFSCDDPPNERDDQKERAQGAAIESPAAKVSEQKDPLHRKAPVIKYNPMHVLQVY